MDPECEYCAVIGGLLQVVVLRRVVGDNKFCLGVGNMKLIRILILYDCKDELNLLYLMGCGKMSH